MSLPYFFFFSSRRRHTRLQGDWSSDVCSSDLRRSGGRRVHALSQGPFLGRGQDRKEQCGNEDRKSTRLNSSHLVISYAVFCLKKKKKQNIASEDSWKIEPSATRSTTYYRAPY